MNAGVYRHRDGGLYQVLGIGRQTETEELHVVYISLTGAHLPGPRMNLRPLEMFEQTVAWPDGQVRPRFIYVGDEIPEGYDACPLCTLPHDPMLRTDRDAELEPLSQDERSAITQTAWYHEVPNFHRLVVSRYEVTVRQLETKLAIAVEGLERYAEIEDTQDRPLGLAGGVLGKLRD
jgi:hypothetical protein